MAARMIVTCESCGVRNNDGINIPTFNQGVPVGAIAAAVREGCGVTRARQLRVDAMHQPRARQIPGAFLAHRAAADNADFQPSSPQVMPRSLGVMRRKV